MKLSVIPFRPEHAEIGGCVHVEVHLLFQMAPKSADAPKLTSFRRKVSKVLIVIHKHAGFLSCVAFNEMRQVQSFRVIQTHDLSLKLH